MAAVPAVRVAVPRAAGTAGGRALLGLAEADRVGDGDEPEDAGGLAEGPGERPGEGVAVGDGAALVDGEGLSVAVAAGWSAEVNVAGQAGATSAAHGAPITATVLSKPMTIGAAATPGRRQCLSLARLSTGASRTRTRWVLRLPRSRTFNISAVERSDAECLLRAILLAIYGLWVSRSRPMARDLAQKVRAVRFGGQYIYRPLISKLRVAGIVAAAFF